MDQNIFSLKRQEKSNFTHSFQNIMSKRLWKLLRLHINSFLDGSLRYVLHLSNFIERCLYLELDLNWLLRVWTKYWWIMEKKCKDESLLKEWSEKCLWIDHLHLHIKELITTLMNKVRKYIWQKNKSKKISGKGRTQMLMGSSNFESYHLLNSNLMKRKINKWQCEDL